MRSRVFSATCFKANLRGSLLSTTRRLTNRYKLARLKANGETRFDTSSTPQSRFRGEAASKENESVRWKKNRRSNIREVSSTRRVTGVLSKEFPARNRRDARAEISPRDSPLSRGRLAWAKGARISATTQFNCEGRSMANRTANESHECEGRDVMRATLPEYHYVQLLGQRRPVGQMVHADARTPRQRPREK